MTEKMRDIVIFAIVVPLLTPIVISNDIIPADQNQIERWFQENVRRDRPSLDNNLVMADKNPRVITVSKDGGGNFNTVRDAVKSIPSGSQIRTIIAISGGTYFEKIHVPQNYVTFYGHPSSPPMLVYNDIAKNTTSVDSASVTVEGQYFVAVNIIFKNSAPRRPAGTDGAQAAAFRVVGDKAAFYSCKFLGFQDTLCDDTGRHFYKDCYVEGTIDFVWGNGKSIFLRSELRVIEDLTSVVAAHCRNLNSLDQGYSFVHCAVTGAGYQTAFLGRAIQPYATMVYSYTAISNNVNPLGWSTTDFPAYSSTVFFREYKNSGATTGRAPFSKNLSDNEAKLFLSLSYIDGSKWLLPPPQL